MTWLRRIVGLVLFAAAFRWAWRSLRGVDTRELAGVDTVTGLRLRTGLTPAEAADARRRERSVELVG